MTNCAFKHDEICNKNEKSPDQVQPLLQISSFVNTHPSFVNTKSLGFNAKFHVVNAKIHRFYSPDALRTPAKVIIFNAEFLVFDTKFIIYNKTFISFTRLLGLSQIS